MTKHDVLIALGPGGTTELAERVLALLDAQTQAWFDATERTLTDLELGGLAEVSELLGKSPQSVGHWIAGRRHPGQSSGAPFPESLVTLSATPVWDLGAIREWAADVGLSVNSREDRHAVI
jgi:hypothetical protein